MSTRSNIAIKRKNGKVESIYCHWDGYLGYNGKLLLNYYKDINKINKLIDLGDISSLNKEVEPLKNQEHSFDKPIENVVVAYGRDRGETGVDKKVWKNLNEYLEGIKGAWIEYIYIFYEETNKWFYSYGDSNFKELTQEEIEEKFFQ